MKRKRVDLFAPEFRNGAWAEVVSAVPCDLTIEQFLSVLPPLGPRGSAQNVIRFARVKILAILGFTVRGGEPSLRSDSNCFARS